MANINTFKIPTNVDKDLQYEDMAFEPKDNINREVPEGATLVKKSEVKNATTSYKTRKIGQVAIFSIHDKLAA